MTDFMAVVNTVDQELIGSSDIIGLYFAWLIRMRVEYEAWYASYYPILSERDIKHILDIDAKVHDISTFGEATIVFDPPISWVNEGLLDLWKQTDDETISLKERAVSRFIMEQFIKIDLVDADAGEKSYKVPYSVLDWTSKHLKLQLYFKDPFTVSKGIYEDFVTIRLEHDTFFHPDPTKSVPYLPQWPGYIPAEWLEQHAKFMEMHGGSG